MDLNVGHIGTRLCFLDVTNVTFSIESSETWGAGTKNSHLTVIF